MILGTETKIAVDSSSHYFGLENLFGGYWDNGQHVGASKPLKQIFPIWSHLGVYIP
jgi:hypothetical protein